MTTRREFLRKAGLVSAATLASPLHGRRTAVPASPEGPSREVALNEDYWSDIAAQYTITDRVTNLEGGFYGMMANPVREAYHRHIDRVNLESSFFARTAFPRLAQESRLRVATALGIDPGEIAFSRNATEALQALIGQYNRLQSGDTVMYADLDYPAMQMAMDALAGREEAGVATLVIPESPSHEAIMEAYTQALDANPRTRLLLLTHANNKTGLIHPVKDVTALARSRGVDVVVDAAHSWGHVPFDIAGLGADYVGINLHKWMGVPLGIGVMYIRGSGLSGIDRAHGDRGSLESIDSRLHTGTVSFAGVLTIPTALDFQDAVGLDNKYARVRYLRDLWVNAVRPIDGIDILTPDDDTLVGAITSFRLHGNGDPDANRALAKTLQDEFGIFTVARSGVAGGDCVRVTPALYNLPPDLEKLVAALRVLAAR
ncbi:MAG: isopenicillin-N epimerase [Rhodothermales bacterium]|jgi:isopenicillin-N epimerase